MELASKGMGTTEKEKGHCCSLPCTQIGIKTIKNRIKSMPVNPLPHFEKR